MVWQGVKTQEEDLCRSSNLYEYLIKEEIPFYNNHRPGGFKAMIHKDVTFFRDSNLQWLPPDKIKKCDIISCPAQIYPSTLELETKKRMRCILWLAADADVLVLGRWGCGAFGNDWEVFKKWWDEVIEEERLMAEVDV